MKDFKQLLVWEKSHVLTLEIYRVTKNFPREEQFGLTRQIRRAGASIPANIAEGCGRGGDREFCRFLQIAMGSACELEYHLILTHDLGFLGENAFARILAQVIEVKKMLATFISKLIADS